ncbi:MAG: hypothetical protein JWQ27_1325 [Ferruginibacter sp.]|nr:hypothetical protein [Ferruginibacter sp.]
MSLNLIETAKGLFTPDLQTKTSAFLGESDSSVSKAISAVIPAIFAGLLHKSATPDGAVKIAEMAGHQSQADITDHFGALSGGNNHSGILDNIFGSKLGGLSNLLSGFSGIKQGSASTLLSMAAPLILSFLGKHTGSNQLNPNGLASLLSSQKQHIADATPAGFNLASLFSPSAHVPASDVKPVHHPAGTPSYTEEKRSGLGWLVPILLLALLAAAALYFFNGGCNKKEVVATHETSDTIDRFNATPETTTAAATTGTVDSSGNYIYNTGNMIRIDLPNGAGSLNVGENSTEAKLVRFLQGNEAVDTAKGNWFDFTNVRFNTGSSTITEESMAQLKNMVLISKAFPNAKFKVGGYTDNTGAAAANLSLSKSRAAAVASKIKSLGAAAGAIVGSDGYGPEFPVGDNNTAEGRAQNRRVSVNVKAK